MKTRYTRKQLKEAIAYWKGKLAKLNEEDEGDTATEDGGDGKAIDAFMADEETVQKKAESNPVGVFDLNARMHRLHIGASNKVKKALEKFLNKYNVDASGKQVLITNSCDPDNGGWEMPKEGDKMVITVQVSIDRASVKGFRKMVALMKENDEEFLNEGFWGDLWSGFTKGAAELKKVGGETIEKMGKTAAEKIKNANEKLKKQIGLTAIRMYTESFCGKALAGRVGLDNIQIGQDDETKEDGEITFAAAFDIK